MLEMLWCSLFFLPPLLIFIYNLPNFGLCRWNLLGLVTLDISNIIFDQYSLTRKDNQFFFINKKERRKFTFLFYVRNRETETKLWCDFSLRFVLMMMSIILINPNILDLSNTTYSNILGSILLKRIV